MPKGMSALSRVLTNANAALFLVLAVASVREYRRGRGDAPAWAAAAFVTLGVLAAVGLLARPGARELYDRLAWQVVVRLLVGMILAIPYFLYRLAATFHRPTDRIHRCVTGLTIAVIATGFALPKIPGPDAPRPAWLFAYAVAVSVQWTATSVFAAVWLWRAGAGRPTAPRNRMRLLAIGCAGFNVLVLVAALRRQPQAGEPSAALLVFEFLLALIFYLGLVPPRTLLERWRRPEQAALRSAMSDLVSAMTASEVGERLLPHVVAYVGAQGAALVDSSGEAIAACGNVDLSDDHGPDVLRFALRSGGALVVHSSTFSSLFGADKLPVLRSFADWAELALGRCAAIEREREFIANAAHELRTPLTSLTGFTEMLARERAEMSEGDIERCLDAMVRQGARARDLVNNLLDMAQIERGTMHFTSETFEVADVVHDSVDSAPTPAGHSVRVHVPDGMRLRTDRTRLEQILVNLIANAYRYGGPTIDIAAEVDEAGRVVVKVADDGDGVPAELVPKLFDPFARAVASNGSGSGLGLAICRQIATALGGSISYEPADSGARFVVTLPDAA